MKEKENKNSAMSNKERADCLCQLYNAHIDRWKHTRDIWFKICLTLWTLIILAGYSVNMEINLCTWIEYVLFIIAFIFLFILLYLVYYHSYRKKLFESQRTDMIISFTYRKELNELLGIELIDDSKTPPINFDNPVIKDSWKLPELWITLFLYFCAGAYIFFSQLLN